MKVKKIDVNSSNSWIVKHLVLGILFIVALVMAISFLLSVITQHNKEIDVPDFSNLTYSEAVKMASHSNVRVIVEDSIYVRRLKPGVVCSQNPEPGAKVKKGRRVRLTTNTMVPKKVSMPSLIGFSMRQARAEIVRNGLVLGQLIYVSDIATNNVLSQQYKGRDIAPGEMINSGSRVDLVVGLSSTENKTFVPNLIGRTYQKAIDHVQDNSLNVGKVTFDGSVQNYSDSLNAVVYSQRPVCDPEQEPVRMGTEISLSFTVDPKKIAEINKK